MYMSTRGLKLPLHSGYSKNVYSLFYMLVIHCVSCVVLENKLTKGSKLDVLVLWDNKGLKD